jgi:polyisoprenoid-binding protein YceI
MKFSHSAIALLCLVSTACNFGNVPSAAASDEPVIYRVDKFHTRILWEAVTGSGIFLGLFNGATGEISFVESDPEKSAVKIEMSWDNLMTGVERLDNDLKSDKFFDAVQFPDIGFTSTAIDVTGEGTATITGDLNLHGVTKSIALDVVFRNHADFGSSERIAFGGTTVIKRSDFGVTHMDDWVEDAVKLRIELEGARRKEAPED